MAHIISARRFRLWFGAATSVSLLCGFFSLLFVGCGSKTEQPVEPGPIAQAQLPRLSDKIQIPQVRFTDITPQSGIRFQHCNGAFGKKLLPETMGSGVAFIDFDNDGLQDILFVNSCPWPSHENSPPPPTLALYRNKGKSIFEDVTRAAGLAVTMYGMGVTVGDYDNDGWPDIFVSGVGGNRLFHNVSDGKGGRRFDDVTEAAGVSGSSSMPAMEGAGFLQLSKPISFPSSCAFLDFDGDGKLDLFVCNYVTWS